MLCRWVEGTLRIAFLWQDITNSIRSSALWRNYFLPCGSRGTHKTFDYLERIKLVLALPWSSLLLWNAIQAMVMVFLALGLPVWNDMWDGTVCVNWTKTWLNMLWFPVINFLWELLYNQMLRSLSCWNWTLLIWKLLNFKFYLMGKKLNINTTKNLLSLFDYYFLKTLCHFHVNVLLLFAAFFFLFFWSEGWLNRIVQLKIHRILPKSQESKRCL